MHRLITAVERSNSASLSSGSESYSSFVQRQYSSDRDEGSDCDSDSNCSSLTSSSGGDSDTFHVFTDASVSVDRMPQSKRKDSQAKQVLMGERQKLQSERQKLELERKKLNDERRKLEEERRRLRRGDDAHHNPDLPNEEDAEMLKPNVWGPSEEQANLEKERIDRRLQGLRYRELEKERQGLEKMTSGARSGYELDRHAQRALKEKDELSSLSDEIDKTSLHIDDLEEEKKREKEERRKKEEEIRKREEENRKKTLEKARMKIQEERRLRQESIRSRIAAEEAEAKRKKKEKEEEERKKKEKSLSKSSTEQARVERAYGWYSKLGLPSRETFKKKIKLIASIDITAEDIDLLPWNGSGTLVNVAKLNTMYYKN
jgi:hypothetical protein